MEPLPKINNSIQKKLFKLAMVSSQLQWQGIMKVGHMRQASKVLNAMWLKIKILQFTS